MDIELKTSTEEEQLLEQAAKLFGMTVEQYIELVMHQHLQRLAQLGKEQNQYS